MNNNWISVKVYVDLDQFTKIPRVVLSTRKLDIKSALNYFVKTYSRKCTFIPIQDFNSIYPIIMINYQIDLLDYPNTLFVKPDLYKALRGG